MPLVRQRLSEAEQCTIVCHLLCDGESQEEVTIRPWIMAALTPTEQQSLADFLSHGQALPRLAPAPRLATLAAPTPTALPGQAPAAAHGGCAATNRLLKLNRLVNG